MRKILLYKEMNKKIAREYSMLKFGDKNITRKLSDKMAKLIQKTIPMLEKDNYVVYATNKYPLNKYCIKNSFLLAEQIALKLKLKLIVGEYKYAYDAKSFYDNCLKRRKAIHPPIIKDKKNLKKGKYKVIMIDDSIVSGTSLEVSLNELRYITNSIIFFSIVKLDEKAKHSEKYVNNFIFKRGDINILKNIIKKHGYIFTSHILRTISELSDFQRKNLLQSIGKQKSDLFEKAAKAYFGKNIASKLFQRLL